MICLLMIFVCLIEIFSFFMLIEFDIDVILKVFLNFVCWEIFVWLKMFGEYFL